MERERILNRTLRNKAFRGLAELDKPKEENEEVVLRPEDDLLIHDT